MTPPVRTRLALLLALTGCTSEPELGEVNFSVTSDGDAFTLDDGWEIEIDALYGVIADMQLTDLETGERLGGESATAVLDIPDRVDRITSGHEVPAGRVGVGFRTDDPREATIGLIPESTRTLMNDEGYAFYVEGRATLSSESRFVDFAWGLPAIFVSTDCVNGDDGKPGIEVPPNGEVDAVIRVNTLNLFTSDVNDDDAPTQFQAFADADNGDMDLTMGELLSVVADDAGLTSSEPEATLYRYLVIAMTDALTLNGDGACTVTVDGSN